MIPHRFQSLVWFLLFLSLSGCVQASEIPSIYSEVPQGKTTNSSSRFELIDDFSAGVTKTSEGPKWKTRFGTEWSFSDNVKLTPDREDGIHYGGSLRIQYELPNGGSAEISAPLNGHDSSRAEFVVLLARKSDLDAFKGTLSFKLSDALGKEQTLEIKSLNKRLWKGPMGEWLQAAVPRSAFKEVDFNQLDRLTLVLTSNEAASGGLTIDEVAFFGPEGLVFESDRDNLAGFVKREANEARSAELLKIDDDRKFLTEVAKDTWLYFINEIDTETHLVVDHIRVEKGSEGVGSYVTPTNIALYWLAQVAAYDLSFISKEEAVQNIESSLATFESLERWEASFWYNYYHTRNKRVTRQYVSVVDNGWLAAGLIVIRETFPEQFKERADKYLKQIDFSKFYDNSNGQLKLGYEADKKLFSRYHYGMLVTEARLASYIAIGKGDLEKEHWARIYRTLPPEWDWQKQIPEGRDSTLFDTPVYEGHYTYLGQKFVPSWGGSLFEFLSPTLLIKEQELGPKGLGKNNLVTTDLHIQHALTEKKYPVWGMAPCATRNGKYWIYREYGIADMGSKGYPDRGVVTPYATFLALATRPEAAVKNLREMLKRFPGVYGEFGFYDSVDVNKEIVNPQYLVLDQGMSFLAIANYLKDGVIRDRFHSDPVGKNAEELLNEEFSI